jgi:hypothetical protein
MFRGLIPSLRADGRIDWRMMQTLVRSMPNLHKTLILANLQQQEGGQWHVSELALATEHAPFRHKKQVVSKTQVGAQRKKQRIRTEQVFPSSLTTTTTVLACVALLIAIAVQDVQSFATDASLQTAFGYATRKRGNRNAKTVIFAAKERLVFPASIVETTAPLDSASAKEIEAFFTSFLSAGGTTKVTEQERTPQLDEFWVQCCDEYYGEASLPEGDDTVVASETSIQFPGLKMTNLVYCGVKLFMGKEAADNCLPYYETVLIAQKQTVRGAPPVVWIFNQLTGSSPSNGHSKTRISLQRTLNGEYTIGVDCKIEIAVEFPRLLLKILPASKEKVEEQGGVAVQKAVSKDIGKCVDGINDTFTLWKKQMEDSSVRKVVH